MTIGDLILARACAVRRGVELCSNLFNVDYVALGDEDAFERVHHDVLVPSVIVAIVQFYAPNDNLNHFHLLLPDGRIASLYDDLHNGFWLSSNASDVEKTSSLNRWNARRVGFINRQKFGKMLTM
jgi:hypothetical protein